MKITIKLLLSIYFLFLLFSFKLPSIYADVPSLEYCKPGQNPMTSICIAANPNIENPSTADTTKAFILTGGIIFIITGISTVGLMEIRKKIN